FGVLLKHLLVSRVFMTDVRNDGGSHRVFCRPRPAHPTRSNLTGTPGDCLCFLHWAAGITLLDLRHEALDIFLLASYTLFLAFPSPRCLVTALLSDFQLCVFCNAVGQTIALGRGIVPPFLSQPVDWHSRLLAETDGSLRD